MKPISPVLPSRPWVKEVVFAKDQPQYNPLPAVKQPTSNRGAVTSRWKLSWRERFRVLFGGSVWLTLLTYDQPLQPILLETKEPDYRLG